VHRFNKYSGASVHEKIFRAKNVSDDERFLGLRTRKLATAAESISAGVSCWLTLAQCTSLLDFGLRKFRFTNGLQERIKFVNRGPTLLIINQQDVTFLTSLFILYMFRTVVVHHKEFYFVWHDGLTKCAVVWRGIRYSVL
jgi:hypothetical protein